MSSQPRDAQKSDLTQQPKQSPRLMRLRKVAVVLGFALWVLLLCAWVTGTQPRQWSTWLERFRPATKAASEKVNKIGRRASGAAKLAYLGDGRADLGKYSVSLFDPLTGTVTRADFKLQGTTSCTDKSSFNEFLAANHRFLREQVMVTIRNSRVSDLDDPKLRLLEKKLMARVNRALGQRFLRTVDFKNFELYQSSRQVPIGRGLCEGEETAAALSFD